MDYFCPCGAWLAAPEPPICLDCENGTRTPPRPARHAAPAAAAVVKPKPARAPKPRPSRPRRRLPSPWCRRCRMPVYPEDKGECWDCRFKANGVRPASQPVEACAPGSHRRVNGGPPPLRDCCECGMPAARTTDTSVPLYCLKCYSRVMKRQRESRLRPRSPSPECAVATVAVEDSLECAEAVWDVSLHRVTRQVVNAGVEVADKPRMRCRNCNARGHPAKDCTRKSDPALRLQRRFAAKVAKAKQRARDQQKVLCTFPPKARGTEPGATSTPDKEAPVTGPGCTNELEDISTILDTTFASCTNLA